MSDVTIREFEEWVKLAASDRCARLNQTAVWRLHERYWKQDPVDEWTDLGGES